MKMKTMLAAAGMVGALNCSAAHAALTFFDINANPAAWAAAVSGFTPTTAFDFTLDPNYGITGFDGPLTTAGGGPVTDPAVADGVVMDSMLDGPGGASRGVGGTGLVAIGPGTFGNSVNAVLANFFVDAFEIALPGPVRAFDAGTLTVLGSGNVDIYVDSVLQGSFAVGPTGTFNLGILSDGTMDFSRVWIHDASGGAEGVGGQGTYYMSTVPEPGTLALLGLGLVSLAATRRRKQ